MVVLLLGVAQGAAARSLVREEAHLLRKLPSLSELKAAIYVKFIDSQKWNIGLVKGRI